VQGWPLSNRRGAAEDWLQKIKTKAWFSSHKRAMGYLIRKRLYMTLDEDK